MAEHQDVISDLIEEGRELERILTGLTESSWASATPAPGWTIAHQVAHLAATFRMAATAAADPAAFERLIAGLSDDFDANVDGALRGYLAEPPAVLLGRWRAELDASARALSAVPSGHMVPWLVRPLPAAVLASAGMMELFGHGQDITDTLGVRRERTDRLWHVVAFGVAVWDFGYQARGLTTPDVRFHFALTAPSGALWEFGPSDAAQTITGTAEDFCLLVTRRRHRDDLALVARGTDADEWLNLAQAYRGPAGAGRRSGQFAAAAR